jgi:hypothetical protein
MKTRHKHQFPRRIEGSSISNAAAPRRLIGSPRHAPPKLLFCGHHHHHYHHHHHDGYYRHHWRHEHQHQHHHPTGANHVGGLTVVYNSVLRTSRQNTARQPSREHLVKDHICRDRVRRRYVGKPVQAVAPAAPPREPPVSPPPRPVHPLHRPSTSACVAAEGRGPRPQAATRPAPRARGARTP